jgi:hypothetical protein
MSIFHHAGDRSRGEAAARSTETEVRLSVGQSALVIAGLSALAWAVLISMVVALRAVL